MQIGISRNQKDYITYNIKHMTTMLIPKYLVLDDVFGRKHFRDRLFLYVVCLTPHNYTPSTNRVSGC